MRILVVEDEPKTARQLDRGLRAAGFEVQTCASAEEGLIAWTSHTFDALVLDVLLPGMSGLAMVQELRKLGASTPVLFLSAKNATEDRIKGLNEGGDDYLVKPYSLPEVVARLRALLRRGVPGAGAQRVEIADLVWEPAFRRISRMGK
ncbi:MAG: response regulator, partial [Acidobacteriota bacterium]|nr:response regulator [Acidobacteriota bacterium]